MVILEKLLLKGVIKKKILKRVSILTHFFHFSSLDVRPVYFLKRAPYLKLKEKTLFRCSRKIVVIRHSYETVIYALRYTANTVLNSLVGLKIKLLSILV